MTSTSRHNDTKAVTISRSSTGAKATTATSTSLKSTGETSLKPVKKSRANRPPFPIALDDRGRVKGLVSYGTRQPMFGAMKY
ncbi:hypothetical protein SERLA73DRAFT_140643 [Serpula lacrymans var. lacrymans S7.3]|uniref:Uncharacterized protein n=1 Tax=Serpula lacrymans var. lacrymans (strain S7.3) TaxID=936435 RepID=F8Q3Z2_SERL3|nr:hypothetical protein SERLA73DRAFT_140643 [Serpula lacrymans var. lacrymans S7.3]